MTTLDRFHASAKASLVLLLAMHGCSRKADNDVGVATEVPVSQSASVGPTLSVDAFALFAGNSVRLQASDIVVGGHVGARGSTGPFLTSGFATAVGTSVSLDRQRVVAGDSVQLGQSSIVGAVQTNRLVDLGGIKGTVSTLAPLPQLPGTQRVTPGTNALNLTGIKTLGPGSFGAVTVSGTLTLQAGTYSMQSLQIANSTIVQAQGQVKLLIAGKLSTGSSVQLKASVASSLRIESSAVDGTGGTLGEQPPAVKIGASNIIQALLIAPNGTLAFGTSVVATGAFAARDIDVGTSTKITWQGGITSTCPLSCDDGNPCTSDACGSNGACTHAATANGFPCDDKNLCTLTDSCQSGVCVGSAPVSCAAAVHCGDAGVCDPATGRCSQTTTSVPDAGSAPVGRDPTLVDFDRLRIGAARLGTSCRSVINAPLGQVVSVSVMFDVSDPSLSEVKASQLACALDMPPGSSCEALRACRVGSVVPPSSLPICVGSDVVTKNSAGVAARVDCTKFGGTCFDTDLGAICGLGPCQPGETYGCDGRATTACVHGIRSRAPCGRGRICGERNDHLIDCIGAGAACTGGDRCDGAKAVRCVPEGGGVGHEAITDCGSMGMGCVLANPTKEAMCVPVAGACNPTQDRAYCTGGDINLCVLNQWWTVSCSSISASGRCALGAGVNGEAACL